MSVFVKICGLTDADGVAVAVDAGANAVGFVFAESVRQVTPAQARTATENCPPGIRRVAVMRHPSNDDWQAVLEEFAPDVLQTDAADFAELDVPGTVTRLPVIRQGETFESRPDLFLYEGEDSGTGETVDWSKAAEIARSGRMILAGGLSPDNVADAIERVRPWGVDASSALESAPGVKDPDRIRKFVGAVRAAENGI